MRWVRSHAPPTRRAADPDPAQRDAPGYAVVGEGAYASGASPLSARALSISPGVRSSSEAGTLSTPRASSSALPSVFSQVSLAERGCGGNPGPNPSYATSPKSLRYCMGLL